MNVKEIVEKALKHEGYDGLFDEDADCACQLGDLMPCGECFARCQAGYLHEPGEDHPDADFVISGEKPAAAADNVSRTTEHDDV